MAKLKGKTKAAARKTAAKKSTTAQLNQVVFLDAIQRVSTMLIDANLAQDYNSSPEMQDAAKMFIMHPKNGVRNHAHSVQNVAHKMQLALHKKYGVVTNNGAGAFMQDYQAHLIECDVPQVSRVMLGLIDTIGGMLMLANMQHYAIHA